MRGKRASLSDEQILTLWKESREYRAIQARLAHIAEIAAEPGRVPAYAESPRE